MGSPIIDAIEIEARTKARPNKKRDEKGRFSLPTPKWFKSSSYVFHSIVIVAFILVSLPVYMLILGPDTEGLPYTYIVLTAVTNSTNLVALAYAIYIYALYDKGRQDAVDKLEERGIEVVTLEDGIAAVLGEVQKFSIWMEENKEWINSLKDRAKDLDGKMVVQLVDELGKLYKLFKERGYSEDKVRRILATLTKIDLDKLDEFIDKWIESQKIAGQYAELWKPQARRVEPSRATVQGNAATRPWSNKKEANK